MDKQIKIAVMTDSNSGITRAESQRIGIPVLPMPFVIDEVGYLEDLTITRAEFFQALVSDATVQTSQPAPEYLTNMWDEILQEYDQIVYIPMSSGLSGSAATAITLAEDYAGKVFVVDNHRISCTQKQAALEAKALVERGYSAQEVYDYLMATAEDASIYIAVATMTYLKKGGRVTPAAAAVASVLNIKPVLQIQGERLDAYAKVRGMKQAQETMLKAVEKDMATRFAGDEVIIKGAYTCDEETAAQWRQTIEARFPGHVVSLDPLSLSVSCHTGPGAVAIVCMKKQPQVGEITYEV